jgi:hypothetical protein
MDQKTENHNMDAEKPNAMFIAAVAISPPARRILGDVFEPSTPEKNLDIPYMMGNRDVNAPICKNISQQVTL